MATRTGTRVPSFRINSFSNGVQAPKRSPSSCASSSNAMYSLGERYGHTSHSPANRLVPAVPHQFQERIVGLGDPGSYSPETIPAMVDPTGNVTGDAHRLRRSFSSLSWRSLKSRTTLAKPCKIPCSSLRAMVMTLAQNRDPSFFTCQPSFPRCPSAAALFNSSSNPPWRVSSLA